MAVVTKEVLKSYFNDGDVPTESNYIDLIDTMGDGDMLKLDYDGNDDGVVDAADVAYAVSWGNVTEKPSTFTPSAHTHVGGDITSAVANATNADTLDTIHASGFHQTTTNIINVNDARLGGGLAVGDSTENPGVGEIWLVDGTSIVKVKNNNGRFRVFHASYGYIQIGVADTAYGRIETDRVRFYMNKHLCVAQGLYVGGSTQPPDNTIRCEGDGRFAGGVYVGRSDTDAATGCFVGTGDVRMGGGVIVGSTTNDPSTGEIWFYNSNLKLSRHDSTDNQLRISTQDGYIAIGPQNTSYCHFVTDRAAVYFGQPLVGGSDFRVGGGLSVGSYTHDVATGDIEATGGITVGSQSINPGTGDVVYTAQLVSYKNSTQYDVYGARWLTSTVTGWTTGNKGVGTYTVDTSARGLPVGVKAIYFRLGGTWTTASSSNWAIVRSKSGGTNPNVLRSTASGLFVEISGWVPCDSAGDVEVQVGGATLNGAAFEFHGYMI